MMQEGIRTNENYEALLLGPFLSYIDWTTTWISARSDATINKFSADCNMQTVLYSVKLLC